MTKQPLLTADEVVKMLREHVVNEDERETFDGLADYKLADSVITHPSEEIPLLEKCAEFLERQGICVFFRVIPHPFLVLVSYFIAGECGELFHELVYLSRDLITISEFIKNRRKLLSKEIVKKKRRIDRHIENINDFVFNHLKYAYATQPKHILRCVCDYGWDLLEKEKKFLKEHEDLLRATMIDKV